MFSIQKLACLFFFILTFLFATSVNAQSSGASISKAFTGLIFYQDSTAIAPSFFVKEIVPGSPASLTDIKTDDKLISINGRDAATQLMDIKKINQLMEGNENTNVSIEIERLEGSKKTKRLTYFLVCKSVVSSRKMKIFGIGVTLSTDTIQLNGKLSYTPKVQIVYQGSPAANANILTGDYIVAVDGHYIDGTKTDVVSQLVDFLLIDEPKKAQLLCLRNTGGQYTPFNVQLTRADISGYLQIGVPVQSAPSIIKSTIPENDRDGDGILNKDDACPDEAGVYSINPFENGCPEK